MGGRQHELFPLDGCRATGEEELHVLIYGRQHLDFSLLSNLGLGFGTAVRNVGCGQPLIRAKGGDADATVHLFSENLLDGTYPF